MQYEGVSEADRVVRPRVRCSLWRVWASDKLEFGWHERKRAGGDAVMVQLLG
jgi:hypothetical protein